MSLRDPGFPMQGVQGHGGGGAPNYLAAEKGFGVFLGNFLILFPTCWLLLLFVRRKSEAFAANGAWVGTIAGSVASLCGAARLVWMVD